MQEIERKFLLNTSLERVLSLYNPVQIFIIEQRYLMESGRWTIRIRQTVHRGKVSHHLTMKTKINDVKCIELETKISAEFYEQMTTQCGPALSKVRHKVTHEGHCWEIDRFLNPSLDHMVVAEIELGSEDEIFVRPDWLGEEVTHDKRYKNAKMVKLLAA